jgi:transcriptional regulator NrdR family protein
MIGEKIMVKKRSGRLEPFDGKKMARAVSRAGVPYALAAEIAKLVRNDKSLVGKQEVNSVKLREMVAAELRSRNKDIAAKSYLGYKKTKSIDEAFERSTKQKSAIGKLMKRHTKPLVKEKQFK